MSESESDSSAPAVDRQERRQGPILDTLAEWSLYASVGLIVTGLVLPSLHKPGLLGGKDLNALQLFEALWESDHQTLAGIVVACSIVFPLIKTMTAAILFRSGARVKARMAGFMQLLGKWSMLDVFLAAFLIGFTQAADTWKVEPRQGLYVFAIGVLLNHLATARLSFSRSQ